MSSVKALPLGHIISSPMYVVMDRPPPHESSGGQYKRPPHQPLPPPHSGGGGHHSPPLSGTRGYPYPQDPASRCSASTTSYVTSAASSPHLAHPVYASANHVYRDNHFQVDARQPAETHHIDRYGDQHVQHARRRLSLRPAPTPEYNVALDRDRYMDAIRYQYEREREVALGVPYSSNALSARTLKPPVVSVHTPSEMDNVPQPMKRPRLAVEPKAPVHQPLLIDTRNIVIKKEPAYTPQVEAISPTLPPEEGRCESPMRVMKESILNSINKVDKEINQVESQITKLQRKVLELEAEESKPPVVKESVKDACPVELKQMSIAQIIYSENRGKAQDSHSILEKLGPKVEIPMYNQPSDTAVYHENKRKHHIFRSRLTKYFKKKHREKNLRNKHLTDNYNKLLQEWLKKMEKKENNATKKAKDAKTREFFEKQFPELKKQREDKERISRVSTRIRSESEWEEIIDGLQEQEMEEKKMRSYAVIPPIILDSRQRRLCFDNRNGLVEDFSQEYKEKQMLNIWTDSEKEIFREKYLQHPKNFALIASCLERKTAADCIQYYYLSKKGENYKQLLRKHNVRKRRTMVKPPQNQQTSGVTTRQQEDAKASSSSGPMVSAACSVASSSTETTTSSAPLVATSGASFSSSSEGGSAVATVTTTTASSSPITTSVEVTTSTPAETAPAVPSGSGLGKLDKIPLPNNIRKKKEAALMMEEKDGARSDSDTASDHQNENNPAQPCAICHNELDNFTQSRALTKSNCSIFNIKESELTPNMRVCASCRFKTVRKRCPIPTCKTAKRKVKRLRTLPPMWYELSKEAKEAIVSELQIPADVTKSCTACHNRILRRLENNSVPDNDLSETNSTNGWTDYEMNLAKQGLAEHGTDWEEVARVVGTKSKQQCRVFYFSYKRKLGLDEIIQEFKKSKKCKDEMQQDGKPPPIVTDEEESGETTSSCDEDDRADRYQGSSDTASAPSPVDKIMTEVKKETQRPQPLGPSDPLLRDSSPKNDYDSSATMSADEGQNDGPVSRVLPPSKLAKSSSYHPPMKDPPIKVEMVQPMDVVRPLESSVPLVKTLLQDPKIGAASSQNADGSKCHGRTSVRDLIFQAIEVSLNTGVPIKSESPPVAHTGPTRQPSRPSSHHMLEPPENEVQDLSKKVKSRDVSPVRDFGGSKRERVVTPVRPPSGSSNMHYYGAPPPAHCNVYRISQPPPPALSPHYVAEPPHDPYFRGGDSRGKAYLPPERPHSQPPHLVAQNAQNSVHAKPVPIKVTNTVPPPPPLVASKPSSQMSPKMPPYKDRLIPSGSITQGTPVNQQTVPPPPPTSARYENFLRLPPHSKEGGGSITLGTPVQHDPAALKRRPPEGFGPPEGVPRPVMYDSQGVMEYYRQVAPSSQQYTAAFAPGGYPAGYPGGPRPPYANESQLSTKQIMIDFNTSKQMQMRRGGEKEMKVSPRGSDSSPAPPQPPPQENHLHPMYPPTSYGGGPPSHYNHVPGGYQPADSRYMHHRSSTPMDRTRSPSGAESPLGYAPGKRSPSLAAGPAGRQNVIHRSITWGTASKPSVIQATPQSAASPRTQSSADNQQRSETVSPSVRKSTPSPRHHLLYPSSGHDAFNTLVNAAVAQPSLAVPTKDGKGSPPDRVKSPRGGERSVVVVEGLEKTLIDMHQRPPLSKSYPPEHERPNEDGHRYPPFDPHRLSEKQQLLLNEQQSSTLRLGNMREPFSREQFERQMRQTSVSSAPPPRGFPNKKEEERCRSTEYPSPSPQQAELDNEASKIFSQSFQKDAPRSNASPRGFTAANLIDAIITRQINQNVDSTSVSKSSLSSMDLFSVYPSYDDSPTKQPLKPGKRTEIVTIDDEPDNDGKPPSWATTDRAPPVSSSSGPPSSYSGEKVYTLSEHIAAIISKDYNSPSESQPHFNNSSNNSAAPLQRFAPNKPEGMPDGPDHSAQNCPGNGCAYHSHSWKLRKALQQDRDHRPPSRQGEAIKRPASNQSSDSAAPQEERQIIRVAQTSSPRTSPPTGPYGVEPISPPSQAEAEPPAPPAAWNNPGIANYLASRHSMMQEYPPPESGLRGTPHPPPSMAHYGPPTTSAGPNRHQQQMGLSPLDYVKNRIVEVMRTATDSTPDPGTPRPPSVMSHTDETPSHALPPHPYRYTPTGSEPSPSGERPLSNGPPILQQGGPPQRYSPALSRYSPVPPRPSSAAERVPSRNSTPGEAPRPPHKRNNEEWRDGVSSRSVSPEGASNSKKTRTEGTFIPESTTDRAPVLLPQSLHRTQGGPPPSEAPRLSSNSLEPPASKEPECYSKFRPSEVQWREGSEQPASSTTAEPFSPPSSTNRTDKSNSVTTTTERSTPPNQQQRSATSTPLGSTSSSYPSYVSSSTGGSTLYSSASPSLPYSSFSGMGSTTYAYPYSALSMRNLNATHTAIPPAVTNSSVSSSNSNSPSPRPRNTNNNNNQPPPLLSSQYEPLSDED